MLAEHHDRIPALVSGQPDATIDELQALLTAEGILTTRSPPGSAISRSA